MLLMGSHYWKTNNANSDEDYINYITPTRQDLYDQKLLSKAVVGEEKDVNYKDIRMLTKELAKGSLISFQVLYSEEKVEDRVANECLTYAREHRDELFEELKPYLQKSICGELKGSYNNIFKEENKQDDERDEKKLNKYKANAMKLYLLLEILKCSANPFIEWFEKDEYKEKILDIKSENKSTDFSKDIFLILEDIEFFEKHSIEECKTYQKVRNKFIEIIFESYNKCN